MSTRPDHTLLDPPKLPFEPLIQRNAVITEQPWVRWLLTLLALLFLAFFLLLKADVQTRQTAMALAGAAAFLGHLFPVWLKFKGGKGVATFFGTLFAACWPMGLIEAALWLLTAFIFRISSLGALVAAALVVPLAFLLHVAPYPFLGMALFMAVLIYIRHRENIRRLLKGEEPKIGKKK